MADTGDVKSQLLTKIYQSTQEAKDGSGKLDNEPFRMSFNRHNKAGPPTVLRLGYTRTLLSEFEPESKLRQASERLLAHFWNAFYSTASIDAGMLVPFVTEKVIYDQRGFGEEKKGGGIGDLFGGGNKKKDSGGGGLGF